jgi:hypothetical protein
MAWSLDIGGAPRSWAGWIDEHGDEGCEPSSCNLRDCRNRLSTARGRGGALAFDLPLSSGRSLLLALSGVLSVVFGVIMFAHPGTGALALGRSSRPSRS